MYKCVNSLKEFNSFFQANVPLCFPAFLELLNLGLFLVLTLTAVVFFFLCCFHLLCWPVTPPPHPVHAQYVGRNVRIVSFLHLTLLCTSDPSPLPPKGFPVPCPQELARRLTAPPYVASVYDCPDFQSSMLSSLLTSDCFLLCPACLFLNRSYQNTAGTVHGPRAS